MKKKTFVGITEITATSLAAAQKQYDESHSDIGGRPRQPHSLLCWAEQVPKQPNYAELKWAPEDVRSIRPSWSLKRCAKELALQERYIRDRLCELGFEVIDTLIPSK